MKSPEELFSWKATFATAAIAVVASVAMAALVGVWETWQRPENRARLTASILSHPPSTDGPIVGIVHSDRNETCRHLNPRLEQLRDAYAGRATFVVFDVSTPHARESAKELARAVHLEAYLAEHIEHVGTVGIFARDWREVFPAEDCTDLEYYRAALDRALARPAKP